jgi:hypothetical protein
MKKLTIAAALMTASLSAQAAMPCQWQSNWGNVKFISPVPAWGSVRIGLTGGATGGSTSGVYILPVPAATDPVKVELFRQSMALLLDAQARGSQISIETTGEACYKAITAPTVSFITTQLWWK